MLFEVGGNPVPLKPDGGLDWTKVTTIAVLGGRTHMSEEILNQYIPDSVSAPGETLEELLEERGMSQAEFAERTGRPKKTIKTRCKYDAQGRLIEKRERNILFEQTTTIDYNDRGDIARKRETYTDNSVNIQGNRQRDDTDTRFSYQYDSYNNWTEKVVTLDFGSESRTWTMRRTITYH